MSPTRPAEPAELAAVGVVSLAAPPLPSGLDLPDAPPGPWYEPGSEDLDDEGALVHDTTPSPPPSTRDVATVRLLRASDPSLKLGFAAFSAAELRRLADQLGDLIDVCEPSPEPSPLLLWLRQSEARVLTRLAFIDGGAL